MVLGPTSTTIGHVETFVLHVPHPTPVASAIGRHEGIGVVAVRLYTSDGPVGVGWTNVIGGKGEKAIRAFVEQEFVPIVKGRDAFEVRALWTEMYMQAMTRGRKGVAMYALSAVDIALWDVVTQAAGLPVHRYLGAVRDGIAVYGDGCWPSLSMEELEQEAAGYKELGLAGVKVKIGLDVSRSGIREDLRRIDAVRSLIGDDLLLLVDANQAYDPSTAEYVGRHLAERDTYWFEEPCIADSLGDYVRLAARSAVPIAGGENEYSRYGFRDLIERHGVDILQPDVHRVGGITEFMRIVSLADAFNLPVAPHTSYELHGQLLAAATTGLMVEYYPWFPDGFFTETFDVRGGTLAVSETPGLGVRFTEDAVTEFTVAD